MVAAGDRGACGGCELGWGRPWSYAALVVTLVEFACEFAVAGLELEYPTAQPHQRLREPIERELIASLDPSDSVKVVTGGHDRCGPGRRFVLLVVCRSCRHSSCTHAADGVRLDADPAVHLNRHHHRTRESCHRSARVFTRVIDSHPVIRVLFAYAGSGCSASASGSGCFVAGSAAAGCRRKLKNRSTRCTPCSTS